MTAGFAVLAGTVCVRAEGVQTVGVWIKNASPVAVSVAVDGVEACALEAPVMGPCRDPFSGAKTTCPMNSLKVSCVANVPVAGGEVRLKRADGKVYNVRAGRGHALHLCLERTGLTDCFGTKIN